MRTEARLHALDAVRALALLLGIVLHATMSFMPGLATAGFPADNSQSSTLQTVFYVIHVFRMPLFFMIAGYFAHLMFHRKGAAGFARDRAKRIVVPLLVGWVVFGPIAMLAVYMGFGPGMPAAADGASTAPLPSAFPLGHLWFLYYLLLLYIATLTLRGCITKVLDRNGNLRARTDAVLTAVVRSHAAPLLLAAPIALCLYVTPDWVMWTGIASPDAGLTPKLAPMLAFGTAFVFGWLLHGRSELLAVLEQRWLLHVAAAGMLTAASLWLVELEADATSAVKLAYAASFTLAAWNWIFGIIGAAVRFCSAESPVRRYLADASYWMYLAHLPLVFALQMIVRDWPLHWSIKFPIVVGTAVAVLLLTYHYLVRSTYVGEILNGRRYPRGTAAPAMLARSDA